ncbi:MAG: Indole-3-glycerol phosphate synthase [Candidatus Methanolliviera sp. GoM_asphalt]|nr:MAG: Indole-3-glycerol phosphate synthase [Candidatus Methanolliviera sp. GoM_asphalt]
MRIHLDRVLLSESIRSSTYNPVIAEIKVRSPSKGDLLRNRDPLDILRAYERAGAVGISYITEKDRFGGDIRVFKEICDESSLPVLRKDFITDKREIEETAELGASAILLIARMLGEKTAEFVDTALEEGLDTLVEIHDPEDLTFLEDARTTLLGINNRDIEKMEMDNGDVSVTERMVSKIVSKIKRRDIQIVSESGIKNLEDVKRALKVSDAILVGTALMEEKDPEEITRSFVRGRRENNA